MVSPEAAQGDCWTMETWHFWDALSDVNVADQRSTHSAIAFFCDFDLGQ